jgi:glycosyltransferase involved in cell wall biosynthesis
MFKNIPEGKLIIVTEQNFVEVLQIETHEAKEFGNITERDYWRFSDAAREFSKADAFVPMIAYLDDAVYTGKPVVLPAHDLFTVYLREVFATSEHGNEMYTDSMERVTNFARKKAIFVTTAPSTLSKQFFPYIRNLGVKNTRVFIRPRGKPIAAEFLLEKDLRKVIGVSDRYLFYPTQVRPHKNFQLLVGAFAILLKKYPKLKLVLTGNLDDVPEVDALTKELGVMESVVRVKRLSADELYSCYKYAVATPISTMYEAGFSWQAAEAMSVGTPIVLTDADINIDEVNGFGLKETIPLIPGDDPQAFAKEVEFVMNNREKAVARQQPLYEAALYLTWDKAAEEYYELFEEIVRMAGANGG